MKKSKHQHGNKLAAGKPGMAATFPRLAARYLLSAGLAALLFGAAEALAVDYPVTPDTPINHDIDVGFGDIIIIGGAVGSESNFNGSLTNDNNGSADLTIETTDGDNRFLNLLGDNTAYKGFLKLKSGTLVLKDDAGLLNQMSRFEFRGTSGATPTLAIAENGNVTIGYQAPPSPTGTEQSNHRIIIDGDYNGGFTTQAKSTLTFQYNSLLLPDAYGGAVDKKGTGDMLFHTEAGSKIAFTGNMVSDDLDTYGGAISSRDGDTMTFDGTGDVTFTGNKALSNNSQGYGGAIYNASSTLNLTLSGENSALSFVDNVADYGSAIYSDTGTINIRLSGENSSLSFLDNEANTDGTIYLKDSTGRIDLIGANASALFAGGNGSSVVLESSNAVSFTVNTEGANSKVEMLDRMRSIGANTSITKTGAGVWELGGDNQLDGDFQVNGGTLHLYRKDEKTITNATTGNTYTPESATLSFSGSSSQFSLASNARLSVGGGDIVLDSSGARDTGTGNKIKVQNFGFGNNAILAFDLTKATKSSDSGKTALLDLDIDGSFTSTTAGGTISVDITQYREEGEYLLASLTGGSGDTFENKYETEGLWRGKDATESRIAAGLKVSSTTTGDTSHKNLYLEREQVDNYVMTWTGTDTDNPSYWDIDQSKNWTGQGMLPTFVPGDVVNFAGSTEQTIDIRENVSVAGMYVSGSGEYTFTGAGITGSATPATGTTLTGPAVSGKLVLGQMAAPAGGTSTSVSASTFTGTVDFTGQALTSVNAFAGVDLYGGTLKIANPVQLGTALSKVNFLGTDPDNVPTLYIAGTANFTATSLADQRLLVWAGSHGRIEASENFEIAGNAAPSDGGALHNAGTLTLVNPAFSSNTSSANGGAIFNAGDLTVIIDKPGTVEWANNEAASKGDSIYLNAETNTASFTIETEFGSSLKIEDAMAGSRIGDNNLTLVKKGAGSLNLGGKSEFRDYGGGTGAIRFAVEEGRLVLMAKASDARYQAGALILGEADASSAGSEFSLGNGASLEVQGENAITASSLVFANNSSIVSESGTTHLELTGAAELQGVVTLQADNTATLVISKGAADLTIGGTGGIRKLGTGTVILTEAAAYTGATTVSGGTLAGEVASDTAMTVNSGATYRTGIAWTAGGPPYTHTGSDRTFASLNDGQQGGGTVNMLGADGSEYSLTIGAGSFSGTLENVNNLTKNTGGTFTLDSDTGIFGDFTLAKGTFNLGKDTAKSLTIGGKATVADDTTLGLFLKDNAITADNVVLGANWTLDITGDAGATYPVDVIVSNNVITGDIDKATVKVAGNTVDPLYTGPSLDAIRYDVAVTKSNDGKAIQVSSSEAWNHKGTGMAHGVFNVATDYTVGQVLADRDPAESGSFYSAADYTWDGKSLEKRGEGTLILAQQNTYTGGSTVGKGTVVAKNAGAFGTGAVAIANNATAELAFGSAAGEAFANTVTGAGELAVNAGTGNTIRFTGTHTNHTGTVDIATGRLDLNNTTSGAAYSVGSGATLFGIGTIAGLTATSGSEVQVGTGTMLVGGDAAFTGANLKLGTGSRFESQGGVVTFGDGTTVQFTALLDESTPSLTAGSIGADRIDITGGAALTAYIDLDHIYEGGETETEVMRAANGITLAAGADVSKREAFFDYQFYLGQDGAMRLRITAGSANFSNYPDSPNSTSIAEALDKARSDSTTIKGELKDALSVLINAPTDEEKRRVLQGLAPDSLAGSTDYNKMVSRFFQGALGNFFRQFHGSVTPGVESVSSQSGNASLVCPSASGFEFWSEAQGARQQYDSPNADAGYNANVIGGTLAGFRRFGDVFAGGAINYSHGRMNWEDGARTRGNTFAGAVFFGFQRDGFFANADFMLGTSKVKTSRSLAGTTLSASSDRRDNWRGLDLEAGYRWDLGALSLAPSGGVRWYRFGSPKVSERNAGTAGLVMNKSHQTSVELFAKLDVSRRICLANAMEITPRGFVGVAVETADRRGTPRMNFVGQAGIPDFTGYGPKAGRVAAMVGAGFDLKLNQRVTGYLEYQGDFRARFQRHSGQIGVGVSF